MFNLQICPHFSCSTCGRRIAGELAGNYQSIVLRHYMTVHPDLGGHDDRESGALTDLQITQYHPDEAK